MLFSGSAANAAVSILVNKDTQQMTVSVDGVQRYTWPVSSGNPSHETPNGSFKTFRMEEDHYSKEFDDAPMPNAIFFTKQGHAIHGTDAVSRLGSPASHGCVRLSRANALKLWDIVKAQGVLNTTVTLTGSSRVALARNPGRGPRLRVAMMPLASRCRSHHWAVTAKTSTPAHARDRFRLTAPIAIHPTRRIRPITGLRMRARCSAASISSADIIKAMSRTPVTSSRAVCISAAATITTRIERSDYSSGVLSLRHTAPSTLE
jgi:hypothetical protein